MKVLLFQATCPSCRTEQTPKIISYDLVGLHTYRLACACHACAKPYTVAVTVERGVAAFLAAS